MAAPAAEPDWEASKENFQPLKTGRKAAALRDSTAELRTQAIEGRRRAFWEELAAYSGSDPLEVWLRFIRWTQDTFSAGGHKAELLPLLERCTAALQGEERYKQDIRYLRADCLPDPGDVFSFLKEQGIGQEHALYYVEAGQAGSGGAAGEAGRPTLRQRLDRGGSVAAAGEEGIIQDPLHLHKAQAHVAPLPGFPGGAPEAPPAKRRREEAMAFDQGEELCFEEARAAAWLQRRAAEEQAAEAAAAAAEAEAGDDLPDMNLDLEGDTCALGVVLGASAGTPAAAQAAVPAEPPPQQQQQRASPLPAAQAGSPLVVPTVEVAEEACPAAFGSPVMVEAIAAPPSPAEAGAEVAGAEEAPAPAAEQAAGPAAAPSTAQEREEEAAVSPADSTDEAAEPASSAEQQQPGLRPTPFAQQAEPAACEPTVTLSSRDAFAAINQMFGGALPAATAPAGLLAGGGAAAGLEPTVTIATKDAFAALDAMFKGALPQDQPTLPLGRSGVLGGSGSGGIGHAPFGGSGGYEPTMTISTKAAFAALNNMFKGALPGEHASLPPTARGPVGGGYEPTVTISTMAAFEAVNSMFGGGTAAAAAPLQQPAAARRQQGGFRAPAPRPRPAADSLPADSPAGGGGGGFSINEDTQFVSVPLGCDDGDDGGAAGSPGAVVVGGGGMGSFCVHEDTQFITVSAAGADEEEEEDAEPARQASPAVSGGGLGGLMIREDTQYITVAVPQRYDECTGDDDALAGEAIAAVEGGEWAPAGTPDPSQGFRIREDTRHAGPPAAAAAGGSFCIREDTMFLGLGATPATSPGSSLGGTAGCPSGGPGSSPRAARKRPLSELRDGGSTGDLLGGGGDASPLLAAGSPAHSANDGQVGKWGFAPGADDTLALQLDLGDTQALLEAVGQAAAADPTAAAQLQAAADGADGGAAPGASPALEAHLEGLQLADSKENLPVEAAAVAAAPGATARSLSDPVAAAAALRPLGEARAAALGGVEVEWNVEAEAAVVAAGLPEQDSFMVWVDDGEEGSPPLMGSPAGSGGSQTCAAPAAAGAAAAQPGAAAKKLEQAGTAHLLSPAGEVVAGAGFVTPVRQWPEGGAGEVPALDPFSPSFRGRMLACLEPAVAEVSLAVVLWVWQWRPWLLGVPAGTLAAIWWQQQQWPGVHCMSEGEEAEAEVGLEAAARGTSGLVELQLCGLEFAVSGCIGEGAYARVFQGVDGDCGDVALKLEGPPCPWEWYVCKALAARVPPAARRHFVDPSALLLGAKASVLVAPLGPHGSLQDLVNAYLARQQAPPEALAMHFAVQLLRIMREMHAAHVVHTDIKPDNLLVTVESGEGPGGNEAPGPALGLQLIDFGRALDLDLLPAGALLQGDSGTDSFRCVEMREGRPWVWQADAYGVAATVHCLLYGRYMEVERVQEQATGAVSLRLCEPFKRHWAAELWGPFFSLLLNHTDVDTPPSVEGLISAFEARLSGSREAARQLRQEMSRAAALLPQRC
ncbi:hypothetical protein CHLNCDRAFT_135925 [Chlorella variabilis]|uniref:Protein kinase domain-containing protein n=1 Tax=Chlorella variabilis TaxID=554065 RepID=E1ZJD8_CHLVA|nr:hypothetical protein CHLNCDRAFT_135925 [Chlorella variabilis]EFN53840.1 hypothetical protein CHLNCDRAFT_135925 [Chlorella variabilis]|eukprot:XP_005845942.1 hypothetical protein CHLNCDRAFT_135925 [Chlorella variabilis]